jgi:hypothetical protein
MDLIFNIEKVVDISGDVCQGRCYFVCDVPFWRTIVNTGTASDAKCQSYPLD